MTTGRTPESSTGAILRALGSLIAAIGDGTNDASSGRVVDTGALRAAAGELARAERQPSFGDGSAQDAALLLADARERAQRLLDESMERARDLLVRPRAEGAPAATGGESTEPLRRSMQELIHTVHDVQERLDRIEALLRERTGPAGGPSEERRGAAPVAPPAPRTPAAEPAGLPPSAVPPVRQTPQPAYSPPPPVSPSAPVAPAPTTPDAPPVPPPPPTPPQTPSMPAAATPPPAAPAPPFPGGSNDGAPLATFTPADGAVILRATPIAGFQGLMRVQDALARLPAVRQATVEAYAQGEARMRVELSGDVDSDEIATALSEAVGQPALVREADERDRTMLVVFG